jgi:hypothetical protein
MAKPVVTFCRSCSRPNDTGIQFVKGSVAGVAQLTRELL